MKEKALFHIGAIPIKKPLALAPMDGFSDQPFRSLCREFGSGFSITEYINAMDGPGKLKNLNLRISFRENERPIGFQIFDNNPQRILNAAKSLLEYQPDFFDLNLGCSVRRVAGRGAGSGLLQDIEKIREITNLLVKNIPLPITAKIRLGWEKENSNFLEIAKILDGNGVQMITVHGRYSKDSWKTPAVWEPVAMIKESVSIPVIGNGDILSFQDAMEMITLTGCDSVMVGRGAIGNPWIFSGKDKTKISQEIFIHTVLNHWLRMVDFYGIEKARYKFKKHLKAYMSNGRFSQKEITDILTSVEPIDKFQKIFQSM